LPAPRTGSTDSYAFRFLTPLAASGSLHVRNEHANVQTRINGIMLPDGDIVNRKHCGAFTAWSRRRPWDVLIYEQ
jgi:hypothetical protein